MSSNDKEEKEKQARGRTSLDSLKRKREEIRAPGYKAPEAEAPHQGLEKMLQSRAAGGGKLRDLLGKRQQGKGGEIGKAGEAGGGGKGQLLKRLLEARKAGGDDTDVKSLLQRLRGGGQAGGARLGGGNNETLEDRRARLQRFIERLQKD